MERRERLLHAGGEMLHQLLIAEALIGSLHAPNASSAASNVTGRAPRHRIGKHAPRGERCHPPRFLPGFPYTQYTGFVAADWYGDPLHGTGVCGHTPCTQPRRKLRGRPIQSMGENPVY